MTIFVLAAAISACTDMPDMRPEAFVDKAGETWVGVMNAGKGAKGVCIYAVWEGSTDVPVSTAHSCRYPRNQILLPSKARIFKKGIYLGKKDTERTATSLEFSLAVFFDKKANGESRRAMCTVRQVSEALESGHKGQMKAVVLRNHHNSYVGFENTTSSFLAITGFQPLNEPPWECEYAPVFLVPPGEIYVELVRNVGAIRYRQVVGANCSEPIVIDFTKVKARNAP
jgi:hypothetical protein